MNTAALIIAAMFVLLSVFQLGRFAGEREARARVMIDEVRQRCAREVPVAAVWREGMDQVVFHFSPTTAQERDRWCKRRGK